MSKLALLFTGQGSQFSNMGLTDLESTEIGRNLLDAFSSKLSFDVKKALINASNELDETVYAQPLIMLLEMHLYEMLKLENIRFDGYLGFSLGEITALYASGAIKQDDIIDLINHRSKWMQEASTQQEGAMAAVMGLDAQSIVSICQEISTDDAIIMPVNFNTQEQTVISGAKHLVDAAIDILKEKGAKRVIPLAVSGAFHTPYMALVSQKLDNLLQYIEIHPTDAHIYLNTTGLPHEQETLRKSIALQVQSPVYFHQSILNMVKDGYTHFIEIGPKAVLSSMLKKIDLSIEVTQITNLAAIEDVKGWLKTYGFKK